MDREVEELISKAKKQDPDAFTQLMELHMHGMYQAAYAILRHDEDAADAIQDTILTCWEKLETLRENRYFKTWLTRILINNCYGIRKNRREEILLEEAEWVPAPPEKSDVVWKDALAGLGEEYRLVVTLYYGQGFRTREIAKILGMTDAAVRTRLARARVQLKKYYQEEA